MRNKDLLTIDDLTISEMEEIWRLSADLKRKSEAKIPYTPLTGKTLAMIFHKHSTRTRISFEVGMFQLGGHAMFLGANDIQLCRGESVADTAKILSLYVDGILIRTYAQEMVEEMAREASVPVINGLTDLHHPCQIIADLFTVREKRGQLDSQKMAYIGDGNNIANSLLQACAKSGMRFVISTPKGYEPNSEIFNAAQKEAPGKIEFVSNPYEAAKNADVIYTDVWTSMGQEQETDRRLKDFEGFQVDEKMLRAAAFDVMVMHCLPAHRGEEVSAGVIDGPHSIVYEQAQNRLHVQKAIMALLMG